MTKERKSNREAKKSPVLTMKEKKAAKKSKKEGKAFLAKDNATRRPAPASGTGRP